MRDAKRITLALRGHWHGHYGLCFCPSHANSHTPALSVSDSRNGKLLLRCHAGCRFSDILDALKGLGIVDGASDYSPPTATAMQLHTDPALWHAYATHDGGRCSHYVGDYETAFSEGMRYYRLHGGKIHIERID